MSASTNIGIHKRQLEAVQIRLEHVPPDRCDEHWRLRIKCDDGRSTSSEVILFLAQADLEMILAEAGALVAETEHQLKRLAARDAEKAEEVARG